MTLFIHRAERADRLADALGDLLADPLDDPFAGEIVSVPTRGVERWLSQTLSHKLGAGPSTGSGSGDGVCAGVDFTSPRRVLARVFADLFGGDSGGVGADPESDPWRPDRAVWPLLALIDESISEPWCAALATYLGLAAGSAADDHRAGRRYATARHLADLFDSYGSSRPQLLQDWRAGRNVDGAGQPLAPEWMWQPELWRRLRDTLGTPSPAEQLESACAVLRDDPTRTGLPARLSIFGPTRLAGDLLAVLGALSQHRAIHLWVPHASPGRWEAMLPLAQSVDSISKGGRPPWTPAALRDRTETLPSTPGASTPRRSDASGKIGQNRLLTSLSRDSREFQLSLYRTGAAITDQHYPGPPAPATLLGRLQSDLAADRGARSVDELPMHRGDDRSIQFHASHGPDRQVEVLREVLLGLLSDDPTLEPRDIVVMCPDIEAYAPLISASFGLETDASATDHPGHRLRVRLADRSLRQLNPLLSTLARLLELAESRLESSAVLDFWATAPVARKFRFTEDELGRLRELVISSGVRWGVDPVHREAFKMGAFPQNTWSAGLSRLLLGVAMSEDGQHYLGTALPLDDVDSSDVDLVGRLAECVDRLQHTCTILSGRRTLSDWVAACKEALDALTSVSVSDNWQLSHAYAELGRLVDDAAGGSADHPREETVLSLTDIRTLLGESLRGRASRANFRTGTLTICTMMPMRSVPHRVVCLLGIDEGTFPRSGTLDGDDLLAVEPCLGDRDPRSEDRQLLLDAVMSAEDHFVVIFSGADPRTNQPRPPAVPVGELLDALDQTARPSADVERLRDELIIRHPLQPFDPANFVQVANGPDPTSFDPSALAGARAMITERSAATTAFSAADLPGYEIGEVVELADLIRFFNHPIKALLRARAGLVTLREDDQEIDEIPVVLDPLQGWAVGDRMLRLRLDGQDQPTTAAAEWRRGVLPPQRFGGRALDKIAGQVEEVMATASPFVEGAASSRDVLADLGRHTVAGTIAGVRGDSIVTVHFSRLAAKHRLQSWLSLLALIATDPSVDWRAVTVGRGGRSVLGPVPAEFARLVLADLVDLYRTGLQGPIPLAPKASAEYARIRAKDRAYEPFKQPIGQRWDEDRDDAYELFYGVGAGLDRLLQEESVPSEERGSTREPTRFGTLARRVWQPLLGSEVSG